MAAATQITIMLSRSVSSLVGHVTLRSSPTTSPIIRTLKARRATSPPTLRGPPGSLATTTSPLGAVRAPGTAGRTSSAPVAADRSDGSYWNCKSALCRWCIRALREFWLLPDGPSCICSLLPPAKENDRRPIRGHRFLNVLSAGGGSYPVALSRSEHQGEGADSTM